MLSFYFQKVIRKLSTNWFCHQIRKELNMDSQLLTLSKIFTERLFRIPDYQRGYAWASKQLRDFWNDISQFDESRNHYTGVLTLEAVPETAVRSWHEDQWIVEAKSYQAFYVVDGQQRLTTAIILLQVILESLEEGKKLNYTTASDIQRKFIFDSKDDGISRSYVFGYEKDNPSYEFLKTRIFCEHSSTSFPQKTVYTHNLEHAKNFFSERVAALTHDDLEILYKKVTQHLLFNIFTISEDVDVCVAFETMNNRGKPLSYLELLKNRLIYLSLKFDAEDYEKAKLRRSINDCWKAIYHNLGRNKDNPLDDDKFLLNHYVVYFGKDSVDEADDLDEMRYHRLFRTDYARHLLETKFIAKNVTDRADPGEKIVLTDIYSYVSSLQQSVECWYRLFNPFDSGFSADVQVWLDKLNRLGMDPFVPLIMVFFQKVSDKKKRLVLLKAIERHMFLLSLVGYMPGRHLFHPESGLIMWAIRLDAGQTSADKAIKEISDMTFEMLKRKHFIDEMTARFRSEGFYKWDGIRYFLYEYNLELQERSKTKRPKIAWAEFREHLSDFVSVEHIYPQQARHKYWVSRFLRLTQKQKTVLRHSLGNLLPLSKPKNSSLSNKPFPEKIDGQKDHVVGYRYGCYAENEVSKTAEWTPNEILERGITLLGFLEHRWNLKLGNRDEKIRILGLEFLKKKSRHNK